MPFSLPGISVSATWDTAFMPSSQPGLCQWLQKLSLCHPYHHAYSLVTPHVSPEQVSLPGLLVSETLHTAFTTLPPDYFFFFSPSVHQSSIFCLFPQLAVDPCSFKSLTVALLLSAASSSLHCRPWSSSCSAWTHVLLGKQLKIFLWNKQSNIWVFCQHFHKFQRLQSPN